MSRYVTLSAIGAKAPDFSHLPKQFSVYEKEMKKHLLARIEEVLPSNPDLIVFPECANRYVPNTRAELKDYYRYIGDSMADMLKGIAKEHHTNIAYSAYRYAEPESNKPFRNSTMYIGRNGEICGIYDKNHLVAEEYTEGDVAYGTEAPHITMDFGTVGSVICFDLNFDELMSRYQESSPDLLVFSSMFHGGLMRQAQWAYTCRSYFISAVCDLPCNILNPYGEVVASSTNYTKHVTASVNLDYALCHIDYNSRKISAAKQKYKEVLTVHDPGFVGSVMLSCEAPDMTVRDILTEFEIETLDAYFTRVRKHRAEHL